MAYLFLDPLIYPHRDTFRLNNSASHYEKYLLARSPSSVVEYAQDHTVVASLLDSAEERPDSAEHRAGEMPDI